jgi:hypothetical protein
MPPVVITMVLLLLLQNCKDNSLLCRTVLQIQQWNGHAGP